MSFYKTTKPFLFFFLWFHLAFSQNYPTKNYTAANELPNNAVRSLLVDSNNILWIGTENGIVKKENDEFQYFFEEDGLAQNSCWAIAEDEKSNLWFGSYGEGLSIYDGYKFKTISEKDGLVHNEITKLFSFGNFMYVGTSNGISIINVKTYQIHSFKNPQENDLFRVQDFFEYKKEIYVVTYNSGVYKINIKKNQFALVKLNNRQRIYSVFVDKDSIYSSHKGFFKKNLIADFVSEKHSLPSNEFGTSIIWDYVKSSGGRIFAAAWGIYESNGGIYEVEDDKLLSMSPEFGIASKEILSLAYDATFQKLYVGTKEAGLFEIALDPQVKFNEIKGKTVLGFGRTGSTSAILLKDALLLTKDGHQQRISLPQLKEWQEKYVLNTKLALPKHKDDFYELEYATKTKDIVFHDIKTFQNIFWINTNIGLFAIKDSGKLGQYLPLHSEEINFSKEGNLIETNPYGGVRIYSDLTSFKYTHYKQSDSQTPTMVVNSLKIGSKTYFLSVFSGLYVWEKNKFKSYFKNGIWKEKKLKHITPLERNLAVSNEFGDVFILNDEETFKIIKKIPRAKIHGNSISFLREYKGTLIIGTEKGITFYKKNRFIFLDKEQGLEQPLYGAEVNKNILFVGSNNGYYHINIDAVIASKILVDQITLTEFVINNNKFSAGPVSKEEEVRLGYDQIRSYLNLIRMRIHIQIN